MIKLKETTMRKTWVVCLLAMVCCALWGSAFPCIKVGYRLFQIDSADTATQILFAGCRFTIAGIMVILFGSILPGTFSESGEGRSSENRKNLSFTDGGPVFFLLCRTCTYDRSQRIDR